MLGVSLIVVALERHATAQQPGAVDLAQQNLKQIKVEILNEIRFLKRVVELTPEQHKRLLDFNFAKLQDIRIMQRRIAPGVDFADGNVRILPQANSIDPLKMRQIERVFEKELAAVLTPDQLATYAAEKKIRDDFYKDTAVRGILTILDMRLYLSKNQREELYESLHQWGGITSFDMTPYVSSSMYLPAIPDSVLVNHLNENQRAILATMSRIDFGNRMQIDQNLQHPLQLPVEVLP